MIYHVFRADVYFLTIPMIKNIIDSSNRQHFFIIVGSNLDTEKKFNDFFARLNFTNFHFIRNFSSNKLSVFFRLIFNKILKINYFPWEFDLFAYLLKIKNSPIIIHAEGSVVFGFIFSFFKSKKKYLVIWGSVYNSKNYSFLYFKLRKAIYNSYKQIICLMPEDCIVFKENFNYLNGVFIPYGANDELREILQKDLIIYSDTLSKPNQSANILLGNNGNCIDYYFIDLKRFETFAPFIESIDCMMNYGSSTEKNGFLLNFGKGLYAEKFHIHTQVLPMVDYLNFIKKFDIYFSSREDQSGLGAIYMVILCGMKVFLTGSNLNFLRNLGIIVFDVSEFDFFSHTDLLEPLSNEIIQNNRKVIISLLDHSSLMAKWEEFYKYM